MDIEEHVIYQLRNAEIKSYPYPHFFVENVFPDTFYDKLLDMLPGDEEYEQMNEFYPDRYFGPDKFLPEELGFMASERFMREVMQIFIQWVRKAYPGGKVNIASDIRFVRDKTGYRIGPHTDAPWKLISLLFYLPSGQFWRKHGTSIYVPNEPAFRCDGGPHYEFEEFKQVYTAPYARNSCFGFWKTTNSFHGVEQIHDDFDRNVLLYNVYDESKIPKKSVKLGESLNPDGEIHDGRDKPERSG